MAGDWLIDTRAPAAWVVPGVELAELQRSTASAAQLSVPTVPPADAVVQVLGHGAHLRPLHTVAPGERIAWDGHVWWVESVEGAVASATAAVASGSADPNGAEGPAPVDVTAAVEPPAALHVTLQATGLRLQRVLATRARPADDVHTLTVRSADGTLQSIRGTADHPVYVQGGDTFQALATLRPGDAVRALDGRPSTVVSVTPDPGPRTVHNLTVEFAPTYFIDAEVREGWGGIWVHNDCELTPEEIREINRQFGGVVEMPGMSAESVVANLQYREGAHAAAASVIRDIAGGHMFNNGNKRTAQALAERILGDSATPAQIRSVIDSVATGQIRSVDDIAAALQR